MTLRADAEIADQMLLRGTRQLGGKSFRDVFCASLREVKSKIQGNLPELLFLTGGVSRLHDVKDWCADIFPEAVVISGSEPEFSVSRGLAWAGRIDSELREFRKEVEILTESSVVEKIVGNHIEDLYHKLFGRVITSDRAKLLEENDESTKKAHPHHIIQTAGIGLTRAKMFDVLADNQDVHIYIFESEIKALVNSLKGTGGITTDHLRKAFENGLVYQNNKLSTSKSGNYPIYLNYTITGTMGDTGRFVEKELEGGTLSRIAWTAIPEAGKELENLQFDDAEVDLFRDKIDAWRKLYCYTTNDNGDDEPCNETDIDLSYLFQPLKNWLDRQYDQSIKEDNPARRNVRARSACVAFHCAIVLHMLYDQPMTAVDKEEVVNATIYIANYVIERFLFKFKDEQNLAFRQRSEAEKVKKSQATDTAGVTVTPPPAKKPGRADAPRLKQEHDAGTGWETLGKKYGCTGNWIKKLVRDYERKTGGGDNK